MFGKCVDIGRAEIGAPVAGNVRVAEVVGQNEHNVRKRDRSLSE